MERDLTTLRYQAASTGTGTLAVTIEELNAVQRALDVEREKVKGLEALRVGFDGQDEVIEMKKSEYYALRDSLTTLQAQLRQVEGERDDLRDELKCSDEQVVALNQGCLDYEKELVTLRQLVEALCRASERLLEDGIGTSDAADTLKRRTKQVRATLTSAAGETRHG